MSMRNMALMFGAMALLRRVDQEEPIVLLYARVGYLLYIALTAGLYIFLHFRVIHRRDTSLITVPLSAKQPSFFETLEQARKNAEKEAEKRKENKDDDSESTTSLATEDRQHERQPDVATESSLNGERGDVTEEGEEGKEEEKEEKTETITVMEYDLRHLANARRSWVTSSCFLAAVHYHMQSVSPLVMSAVMGAFRLVTEDPLVQIHLHGTPAVDKLARPFTPEKNPLSAMLKELAPKEDGQAQNNSSAQASRPESDLHDDGDDDDDDDAPAQLTNLRDDHIKSDFDEEESQNTGVETERSE